MGQVLKKFIPRAPRYVYRPEDGQMLRFALNQDHEKSFTTEIRNISMSGLAFAVEEENAPSIGEVLKIEFPLPGDDEQTAAWWGRVVRLEHVDPHLWSNDEFHTEILVGIQFHDLPEQHRQHIKTSVDERFREIRREKIHQRANQIFELFVEHFWQLFIYVLCAAFTVGFLWYFSQPTENYDSERGSPWGQRFEFNHPWGDE